MAHIFPMHQAALTLDKIISLRQKFTMPHLNEWDEWAISIFHINLFLPVALQERGKESMFYDAHNVRSDRKQECNTFFILFQQ